MQIERNVSGGNGKYNKLSINLQIIQSISSRSVEGCFEKMERVQGDNTVRKTIPDTSTHQEE